jgi:UDPglucose--hexose-1-phosphate uridylyltransferase
LPEFRKDPISGRWVIIATERAKRPTDFPHTEVQITGERVCPFCPGNESRTPPEILAYRASGGANEPGWTLRVIPNKFPALRVEGTLDRKGVGMYDRMNGLGAHEVIIESPQHMETLTTMPGKQVEDLFWALRDRILDLKRDIRLCYILFFKNHGSAAGATLQHTHSQLIALPIVPKQVEEEMSGARRHFDYHGRCIYCDIADQEVESRDRLVIETDHFAVIAPYAPRFPFETWIVPRAHESHVESMSAAQIQDIGRVLQRTLQKLELTLEKPPYNLVVHTAPMQEQRMAHYHWHIEIIPKLAQFAGFEWGSGFFINPTPPEEAARFLREREVQ